jgi:hypothetical protein
VKLNNNIPIILHNLILILIQGICSAENVVLADMTLNSMGLKKIIICSGPRTILKSRA